MSFDKIVDIYKFLSTFTCLGMFVFKDVFESFDASKVLSTLLCRILLKTTFANQEQTLN